MSLHRIRLLIWKEFLQLRRDRLLLRLLLLMPVVQLISSATSCPPTSAISPPPWSILIIRPPRASWSRPSSDLDTSPSTPILRPRVTCGR